MTWLIAWTPSTPQDRLPADTVLTCCDDCDGRFLHIWVPPQ